MTGLFSPITLRSLTVPNRIWLSPMCQYSVRAGDGVPTDWHLVHLGSRAVGGFGLVLTEATAVVPEGRISPADTGIWNDAQRDAWARIVRFVHEGSGTGAAIGMQLAHAGRKGSTYPMLPGDAAGTAPAEAGGWETVGPTALAFEGLAAPRELSLDEIGEVVAAFADAAQRCDEAGFDVVEVHAAHGYLLHQFLSPLSNQRADAYGGSFAGRTRLLVEVCDAIRAVWPDRKPLLVRVSATDWAEGGWTVEETTALAVILREHGVDFIDVSSGGSANVKIPVGLGYQVPLARAVREGSGLPVGAVGLILDAAQAAEIVASGAADVVLLGRAALRDGAWPQRASYELGVEDQAPLPPQYHRGTWSGLRR